MHIIDANLDWNDITDPPSTYTPSSHNHNIGDVSFNGHFLPTSNNVYNIGHPNYLINTIYFNQQFGGFITLSGDLKVISLYPYTSATGYVGTASVRYGTGYINKIYGSVGSTEPLKRPMLGLADLKSVTFRPDGIPIERTLPTTYTREEIREQLQKQTGKQPTNAEIEAIYEKSEETVNINHTIGWLIQCVCQLSEQVETLQNRLSEPETLKGAV